MKINKVAEENKAPLWVFESPEAKKQIDSEILIASDANRLASLPEKGDLDEEQMVSERDMIEKCASVNRKYFYNVGWGENTVNSLKEYASICGAKIYAISSDKIDTIKKLSSDNSMVKTASNLSNCSEKPTLVLDAFKIDEKIEAMNKEKPDWQEVTKASVLNEKPSIISNTVKTLRGGEECDGSIRHLHDKNANQEDLGLKIVEENKEKIKQYKNRKIEWEKEVAAQNKSDLMSRGQVFVTEVLNVQPGIKGELFNYKNMPDKTLGEQIKDINKSKNSNKTHTFVTKGQADNSISDDFSDSLKKILKKE